MNEVTAKPLLLQAFEGKNETIPVWFMRQAGRYLPQYRAIKESYPLNEMFRTPELAAEITCQPIDILGVDAAILFADILTLPQAMGFDITFDNVKGPLISTDHDFASIHDFEDIPHVSQTIKLVLEKLPGHIPLIGFAGAPFTVATYLIEGKSVINHTKTLRYMYHREQQFHQLMERLTQNTIRYAQLQFAAGISVFQLFDSWAGILRPIDYAKYVFPYVQKIFAAIPQPTIYFVKNTHHLLPLVNQTGADFISVDHTVVLGHDHILKHTDKGVQGNLYNGLLYADAEYLRREVNDVLMGG
ncbi:MAG: uroporphyrinogen decarboxylase, partial [Candidatus Omnitrophica bacterium]|nr:uroporphyrinogen decarboxylase [Candidatus Omnitrophota bacterium]